MLMCFGRTCRTRAKTLNLWSCLAKHFSDLGFLRIIRETRPGAKSDVQLGEMQGFELAVGLVSFEHVDWNDFSQTMTSVKLDHKLAPLSRDLVPFGTLSVTYPTSELIFNLLCLLGFF